MADDEGEVVLPALPLSEPSLPAAPSLTITNFRKRPFLRSREPSSYEEQLAEAINTSSDPAVFSSDDTPDAENYSPGMKRRKNTYAGTWWGDKLAQARARRNESTADKVAKKRRFRRNFDSGIFMADDSSGTDLSSDNTFEQELLLAQEKTDFNKNQSNEQFSIRGATKNNSKVHRSFKFSTDAALKRMPHGELVSPKDHLVRKVVQSCLHNNNEEVDWSDMGLDHLPPAITDLRSMIKRINNGLVDSENLAPAPFAAELKIFLANNNFSQFPQPLLDLTNIHLLSMRQNGLHELPPGIRNLVNLEELNVSSNKLRYLPYEVLCLARFHRLKTILTGFNPWMPVPPDRDRLTGIPALSIARERDRHFRRYAVSKPMVFLPNGSARIAAEYNEHSGKAAHLSEVVLRALQRHNTANTDLSTYLTEEHPQSVRDLLNVLHAAQASDGRNCTFCDRTMVLPRYQWYEWWDIKQVSHASWDIFRHVQNPDNDANWPNPLVRQEYYYQTTEILETAEENDENPPDSLMVFQRMACGCNEVCPGLWAEAKKIEKNGQMIKRVAGSPQLPTQPSRDVASEQ